MTIFASVCKLGNIKQSSTNSIGGNSLSQSFGSNGVSCNEACGGNGGNIGVNADVKVNVDAASLLGPILRSGSGLLFSGSGSNKFVPASNCGC